MKVLCCHLHASTTLLFSLLLVYIPTQTCLPYNMLIFNPAPQTPHFLRSGQQLWYRKKQNKTGFPHCGVETHTRLGLLFCSTAAEKTCFSHIALHRCLESSPQARHRDKDHFRPSNLAARTLSVVEHTLSKFGDDPCPVRQGLVACAKSTFFSCSRQRSKMTHHYRRHCSRVSVR